MAAKMRLGTVPKAGTIKKRCQTIGKWAEYLKRREELKVAGQLLPREAAVRAYADLKIEQLYFDHISRQTRAELVSQPGPLTPAEMQEVRPGYKPVSVTAGAEIGADVLSLPEQIAWVKRNLARTRNGGEQPTRFPNEDTLYWWQIAVQRPADFDKLVLKTESPDKPEDDESMRDNERQFKEIERQIQDALKEVGRQFKDYEQEFSSTLDAVLSDGPQGADQQSLVPA